ncbi:MAG: 30S ribosome-binding factor RbfA [Acidobacteriota bacterium]
MSFRIEKVSSTLKTAIGNILLNKMADPDLRKISVSNIILSNDLKIARVYVSSFDSEPEKIVEKLNHARGYIRKELSGSVYLKFLPDLQFFYDTAFEFDQKKVE